VFQRHFDFFVFHSLESDKKLHRLRKIGYRKKFDAENLFVKKKFIIQDKSETKIENKKIFDNILNISRHEIF